jgi:tetratricopeptide (TPR) repeat protein
VFYAESWALMHYLLWDKPERKPQFVKFLDRLSRGEDPDSAFPASFETSYQTIENELRSHVRQARFVFSVFKISDLKVEDAAKVTPLKREEALFRLGDLLLHVDRDRVAEAEDHFREALRIDSGHAAAQAGLAHAAALSERYDEAVALFEKALERDPDDPMTCFHFAQCLVERSRNSSLEGGEAGRASDRERAMTLFGKVISLRPGFAEAFLEYAHLLMEQGASPGLSIHLLETARPMLPSRIDILMNLAALYARKGDSARARDLVENSLSRMNDPEAVERARRRIRMEEQYFAARQPTTAPEAAAPEKKDSAMTKPDEAPAELPALPSTRPRAGSFPDSTTYNGQVAVYNQAVGRANQRDYDGAIALLEDLLKQVNNEDLRSQITALLGTLKSDAARQRKSPR